MSALLEDSLSVAILRMLAQAPDDAGVSLPRLGKRLGQGASVLMRRLTLMGDAAIGGVRGPGWVRVVQHDDRWVAHLQAPGRAQVQTLPPLSDENRD
ncbi:hypothetical protein [Variovorax sp. Root434]|uniref:hypothetical protein n=1 Tax=Variovorax sp. Root434 TaxID=1736536 RepID=UPI0006F74450|nr:hypothetical protein [Variovorax sp. Root434]KQX30131.1 hypothetical protein ASD05_08515 [Variovorax sp. Root434]